MQAQEVAQQMQSNASNNDKNKPITDSIKMVEIQNKIILFRQISIFFN